MAGAGGAGPAGGGLGCRGGGDEICWVLASEAFIGQVGEKLGADGEWRAKCE